MAVGIYPITFSDKLSIVRYTWARPHRNTHATAKFGGGGRAAVAGALQYRGIITKFISQNSGCVPAAASKLDCCVHAALSRN
jgi:hypothetical protein